jgi:rare lipoprotein A
MRLRVFIVTLLLSLPLLSKNGIASYYNDKHHNKKTASGVIYNRDSLTCAHKTLPFGTKLLVTNLSNNKKITVVVTDRGPFIKGRTLDLSYAAANSIGMIKKGIQKVNYEIIE